LRNLTQYHQTAIPNSPLSFSSSSSSSLFLRLQYHSPPIVAITTAAITITVTETATTAVLELYPLLALRQCRRLRTDLCVLEAPPSLSAAELTAVEALIGVKGRSGVPVVIVLRINVAPSLLVDLAVEGLVDASLWRETVLEYCPMDEGKETVGKLSLELDEDAPAVVRPDELVVEVMIGRLDVAGGLEILIVVEGIMLEVEIVVAEVVAVPPVTAASSLMYEISTYAEMLVIDSQGPRESDIINVQPDIRRVLSYIPSILVTDLQCMFTLS
jgi:hypothetical protein